MGKRQPVRWAVRIGAALVAVAALVALGGVASAGDDAYDWNSPPPGAATDSHDWN